MAVVDRLEPVDVDHDERRALRPADRPLDQDRAALEHRRPRQHPGQRIEARPPLEVGAGIGQRLAQPRESGSPTGAARSRPSRSPPASRDSAARAASPRAAACPCRRACRARARRRSGAARRRRTRARTPPLTSGCSWVRGSLWRSRPHRPRRARSPRRRARAAARSRAAERAVHRLVPDPVGVDEADHRHRHLEHVGGERGDPVEGPVRRGVEDRVAPQRVQPLEFRSRIQRHRPRPPKRSHPRTSLAAGR